MCAFLDENGRCAVYDTRPVVCRLWGLPVVRDENITCCEKNFTDGISLSDLSSGDAINQETVLAILAAINHVYCKNLGLDPDERIELAKATLTHDAGIDSDQKI